MSIHAGNLRTRPTKSVLQVSVQTLDGMQEIVEYYVIVLSIITMNSPIFHFIRPKGSLFWIPGQLCNGEVMDTHTSSTTRTSSQRSDNSQGPENI
jgi:hypothetical protein